MISCKPIKRLFLGVMAGAGLAACVSEPVPENHFYRLKVEAEADKTVKVEANAGARSGAASAKVFNGIVEVTRFKADGALSQRPIIYHTADNPRQLKAYHFHFWNQPPGLLVSGELVGYLRQRGVAGQVVTPEARARPDYVISGRVVKLERIVGGQPQGSVELEIRVHRQRDGKLLFSRIYDRKVEAKDRDLLSTVESLSSGVGGIFDEFVGDLAAAARQTQGAGS